MCGCAGRTMSGAASLFTERPEGMNLRRLSLYFITRRDPGSRWMKKTLADVGKISRIVNMKIPVFLSFTMCPELVTAVQRIAAENPLVTAEVYDLNHFPVLKYQKLHLERKM